MKLGNWGSFYPTLNTEGAETKEALTARNIKAVNIMFQPGDELKAAMQKADFAWINKMMGEESKPGDDSGEDDRPVIE